MRRRNSSGCRALQVGGLVHVKVMNWRPSAATVVQVGPFLEEGGKAGLLVHWMVQEHYCIVI